MSALALDALTSDMLAMRRARDAHRWELDRLGVMVGADDEAYQLKYAEMIFYCREARRLMNKISAIRKSI